MFFRCAKGSVCDLLLGTIRHKPKPGLCQTYLTKSKTVTRFPTGEKRQVPSGLKSRFPWL